ncbi:hypothetical protein QBC37DRAFT_399063 [Rhypophila decipiens]|uniref:Uncharacterized protein n=1 Tax=Rhypophila decipiens TaxID=261697 RepID=A0AAN6YBT2_9PEZI|nr:hypothetical protein QBC37DRAFT_399063 [Rhypophila decipiens]
MEQSKHTKRILNDSDAPQHGKTAPSRAQKSQKAPDNCLTDVSASCSICVLVESDVHLVSRTGIGQAFDSLGCPCSDQLHINIGPIIFLAGSVSPSTSSLADHVLIVIKGTERNPWASGEAWRIGRLSLVNVGRAERGAYCESCVLMAEQIAATWKMRVSIHLLELEFPRAASAAQGMLDVELVVNDEEDNSVLRVRELQGLRKSRHRSGAGPANLGPAQYQSPSR